MKDSHSFVLRIDQNNRKTIGGLYRKQNFRCRGDNAVANEWGRGNIRNTMDDIGMNLPHRDKRPCMFASHRSDLAEKCCAVLLNRTARIVLGKPKIERTAAVNSRESADSGTESVN